MLKTVKKTLLLDADMRRPRVDKIMKIKNKNLGLVNYLMRKVSLEKVLAKPVASLPNFDVLPAGVLPPNPTSLLTSNEFLELLQTLKERYEKNNYRSTSYYGCPPRCANSSQIF